MGADDASAAGVVRRWIDALNRRDVEGMQSLVGAGFRMQMPPRPPTGPEGIAALVERQSYGVGMYVLTRRVFHAGDTVVTDDEVELRSVDDDQVVATERAAARVTVRDGLVVDVTAHENLASALAAAGLTEDDEVA